MQAYKNFHLCPHETLQQVCALSVTADHDNQTVIIESLEILLGEKSSSLMVEDLEAMFDMVLDCLNNWNSASNELTGIVDKIIELHPQCTSLVEKL